MRAGLDKSPDEGITCNGANNSMPVAPRRDTRTTGSTAPHRTVCILNRHFGEQRDEGAACIFHVGSSDRRSLP
jgi:hypothetical protein